MAYKVLYRKYRPDNFDNIVGQDYVVKMLKNAIISGKHSHVYIFTGPRGTGKTSSAKVFAKAINCENPKDGNPCGECASCLSYKESPDIIEIDAASNNGVDEIRELINNVKLVPSSLKYKVYIIDEVHMLTTSAFNALLLTLEEPPEHVVFILATTDIQNVPITILSRCQRFDFKPIVKSDIINRLKMVCEKEIIKISDDALSEIALVSAGGMRDALGMLDQLSSDDSEVTLDMVTNYFGSVSEEKIRELLYSVFDNKVDFVISSLESIRSSGTNYAVFVEKLINELRNIAVSIKSGNFDRDVDYDDIIGMTLDLNECLSNINISVDPYILIEILLLKYVGSDNSSHEKNIVINNSINEGKDIKKYFPGNNSNLDNENEVKEEKKKSSSKSKKEEIVGVSNSVVEEYVVPTVEIDLNIRINNTFVGADKKYKGIISDGWVEFLNYLMNKDRNLMSLLTDITVLAASDCYALISNNQSNMNDLINKSIFNLEKYYNEYSGNNYKFAAINNDLWKKEVENYRNNLKNKIKYTYMEENIDDSAQSDSTTNSEVDDVEELVKGIFDSYEVK